MLDENEFEFGGGYMLEEGGKIQLPLGTHREEMNYMYVETRGKVAFIHFLSFKS